LKSLAAEQLLGDALMQVRKLIGKQQLYDRKVNPQKITVSSKKPASFSLIYESHRAHWPSKGL
jgi:hypothetical protein